MTLAQGERAVAPAEFGLPGIFAMLEASSMRLNTPCGEGSMVWHVWGTLRKGDLPLVLLHGGSGSWTHWIRNIEGLLDHGYQVWIPDLPGFGDSSPPPNGTDADAMIEPLYQGMQQLNLLPCKLIGFSFGALTAGLLAAARPDVAECLIVVGAPAMGVVPQRQFALKGWRHLSDAVQQREVHRYNLGALMLYDKNAIDSETLALHQHNVERDQLPRRRLAHTEILAQSLPHISCPVAAIYGERDALYKTYISALENKFRAVTPRLMGFALVPDSGHWVQYEKGQQFMQVLNRFLAQMR